VEGKL